jgi:putative membrane protein
MAIADPGLASETAEQKRTDLAEDRTVLANERTFASWLRTGFGAIALGLGVHALFGRVEPLWLPRAIATAFLAIAMIGFIAAERRAGIVIRRLHTHQVETVKIGVVRLVTIVAVTATACLIGSIWFLTL